MGKIIIIIVMFIFQVMQGLPETGEENKRRHRWGITIPHPVPTSSYFYLMEQNLLNLYDIDVQPPWTGKRRQRRRTSQCDPDLVVPLVAYVGQEMKLQCMKCPERDSSQSARDKLNTQWRFQSRTSAVEQKISLKLEYKRGYEVKIKDMSLVIESVDALHEGKYYCYREGTYFSNYDITVLPKPEFHFVLPNGEQQYDDETDYRNGEVIMYTKWADWSDCNHCNVPGERVRIGYCYAIVLTDQFPGGVPCRSGVVPYSKRRMFADRKDEKMVESCNEPCPTSADDGKGGKKTFFIPFGFAKPTIPSFISRKVMYVDRGSNMALGCPTLEIEKAVRWQNGTAPLRVLDLHQNKDGLRRRKNRVYIDELDVLHIHNVTMVDAATYSCWHGDKNLAKSKIIVVEPLAVDDKMKGQLLYSGFIFTGLIVAMIGFGVFRNRNMVK